MRNYFILIFIFLNFSLFSQEITQSKTFTNAEEFAAKSGTLIERVWIEVGKIKGVSVRIVNYTDLISKVKVPSLRFEKEVYNSYSKTSETKIASLDKDEVEGLIKALEIIANEVIVQKRNDYSEVAFRSRSGFEAGCFSKEATWDIYLKLEKYDSNSYQFLDKENLPQLIELILNAKKMM